MPSEADDTGAPNPWFASGLRPRASLNAVLSRPNERDTMLIGAVGGAVIALDAAQLFALGDLYGLALLVVGAVLVGAVLGVCRLWIAGALFALTASWFGGRGDQRAVRAALAWSCAPSVWAAPLWPVAIVAFGRDGFLTDAPRLDASPVLAAAMAIWVVLRVALGVWSFAIWIIHYAEANGFALWRAVAAWASGTIVFVGVVIAVGAPAILLLDG